MVEEFGGEKACDRVRSATMYQKTMSISTR